jgi:hypothetical protein
MSRIATINILKEKPENNVPFFYIELNARRVLSLLYILCARRPMKNNLQKRATTQRREKIAQNAATLQLKFGFCIVEGTITFSFIFEYD